MKLNTNILTIENTSYTKCKEIGRGSYGAVYEGINEKTKERVAIKEQQCLADFEYQLLKKMKNTKFKNLANIYALEKIGRFTYIVMELCNEGSLFEKIQKQTLEPKDIRYVMKEVSNGIKELHDLGFAHRDIKPENILIKTMTDFNQNKQEKYKLCDFGTAKETATSVLETQKVGTPYYLAPEQLFEQNHEYNKSVDIWAFGAVCYELLIGSPLFNGYSEDEIQNQIKKIDIPEKINNLQRLDRKYKNLLCNMLQRDPKKRYEIEKVIQELNTDARSVSRNNDMTKFNKNEPSQKIQAKNIGIPIQDEKNSNYETWSKDIQNTLIKPMIPKPILSKNQNNYFQNQLPPPKPNDLNVLKLPNEDQKTDQNVQNVRITRQFCSLQKPQTITQQTQQIQNIQQLQNNANEQNQNHFNKQQQQQMTVGNSSFITNFMEKKQNNNDFTVQNQQNNAGLNKIPLTQSSLPFKQIVTKAEHDSNHSEEHPLALNHAQQQKQLYIQKPHFASKILQNQSQITQNQSYITQNQSQICQEIINPTKQYSNNGAQQQNQINLLPSEQNTIQQKNQYPNQQQQSNNQFIGQKMQQASDHSGLIDVNNNQFLTNNPYSSFRTIQSKKEGQQQFKPNIQSNQRPNIFPSN